MHVGRLRALALLLILVLASFGRDARADSFTDTLAGFAKDSFSDTIAAVEAIASSGNARAAPVLRALAEGNLYVRKSDQVVVYTRDEGGKTLGTEAASGKDLGEIKSDDYDQVRLNNRVRSALQAALGTFNLVHPDARTRIEAARALFKSPDARNIPLLQKSLEKEADPGAKAAKELALAASRLMSDKQEERLAGIAYLKTAGDPEVRDLLLRIAGQAEKGSPIYAAATEAIASMDSQIRLARNAEIFLQGLSLGSVLLLAAIGLAITFGVMGVINMAHGEMVMLGAYTTFVVQQIIRSWAPELMEVSVLIAVPLAFLVSGAVGVGLERGIIRHLYGRPIETLLMTWGVSMILQQAVRTAFGPTNREVTSPSWMSGTMELVHGVALTQNRVVIILFGLLVFAIVVLITQKTWFGLQMRAVTQNRAMAASMGIRTGRIDAMTFGLGSGIAGMAGVALAQIDNVSPNLGQGYIVDSFMVVVFGGVGNLLGLLLGSSVLGVVNKFLEPFAGAVLGKIFVLVAIIVFIQFRPRGLFALKGRAAEA
ncbi:MAG TPA: urea ABC transporter permease subunit UrtB [Alphaproteobacteria bacterium]|jgi:urea transport system permease protein